LELCGVSSSHEIRGNKGNCCQHAQHNSARTKTNNRDRRSENEQSRRLHPPLARGWRRQRRDRATAALENPKTMRNEWKSAGEILPPVETAGDQSSSGKCRTRAQQKIDPRALTGIGNSIDAHADNEEAGMDPIAENNCSLGGQKSSIQKRYRGPPDSNLREQKASATEAKSMSEKNGRRGQR
jgi:hypothetical protein